MRVGTANTKPVNFIKGVFVMKKMFLQKKRISILILIIVLSVFMLAACAAPAASPARVTTSATASAAVSDSGAVPFPDGLTYDVEAWAIGCSAVLATMNAAADDAYDPYLFGMLEKNDENAEKVKRLLSGTWGVENREDLADTVTGLLDYGMTVSFADDYEYYVSLGSGEMDALTAAMTPEENACMEFILYAGEAWGDKEIKAWDWFRAMQITGWGYIAGYFDIEETCDYMEQIIERLRATFTSWDEANRNYLDGTAFWMGEDPYGEQSTYRARMQIYAGLVIASPDLFDESVWED